MSHHTHEIQGHDVSACLEACSRCYEICTEMLFTHCAALGGEHVEKDHLTLMADCAQICRTAGEFMLRGSARHTHVCAVCAEICEACADDCERIGEMDTCVTACRECARHCREMAAL